jgi:hypothetical protein
VIQQPACGQAWLRRWQRQQSLEDVSFGSARYHQVNFIRRQNFVEAKGDRLSRYRRRISSKQR